MKSRKTNVSGSYKLARERYADLGIDTDNALRKLSPHARLAALLAG